MFNMNGFSLVYQTLMQFWLLHKYWEVANAVANGIGRCVHNYNKYLKMIIQIFNVSSRIQFLWDG